MTYNYSRWDKQLVSGEFLEGSGWQEKGTSEERPPFWQDILLRYGKGEQQLQAVTGDTPSTQSQ